MNFHSFKIRSPWDYVIQTFHFIGKETEIPWKPEIQREPGHECGTQARSVTSHIASASQRGGQALSVYWSGKCTRENQAKTKKENWNPSRPL